MPSDQPSAEGTDRHISRQPAPDQGSHQGVEQRMSGQLPSRGASLQGADRHTPEELRNAEERIARLRQVYAAIRENVARVIIGQEDVVKLLTTGMMCGGHMLMEGVPGLAKTLMVKTLSETLGWHFSRIQFTPDLMPADITGTEILQSDETGRRRELVFHKGPVFANLILADEINRTPPKTQAALLEAMQEHAVTVNGKTYPLHAPFVVVATQNPIEQEGTYPLPEAQLDRFMLSIYLDYPTTGQELEIAARSFRMRIPEMDTVAAPDEFEDFISVLEEAPVSEYVLEYAVALTTASRPKGPTADDYVRNYVAWGVSPRCTQHLVMAAKGAAILEGRPSPEVRDVRDMARAVLRHRVLPNYNALGEGLTSSDIVNHLLDAVREPARR
jgi:MoxR-like ATPase